LDRAEDYTGRLQFHRAAGPFGATAAPARFALERGDWKAAANLPVRPGKVAYANAVTHFARAIGAARSGDPAAAKVEADRLAELRDQLLAAKNAYWTAQVEIQRLAAAGWTALAEGRKDD